MSKYSNEFKLKVINYCVNEHHGYADAEKHFGVNHESLRKWIKKYQEHGTVGLIKNDIVEYIDYYNNKRIKGKLKGMSPVQYRVHSQAA